MRQIGPHQSNRTHHDYYCNDICAWFITSGIDGAEIYVVKVGTMRGVKNMVLHTLYYDDAPTDRIPLHRGYHDALHVIAVNMCHRWPSGCAWLWSFRCHNFGQLGTRPFF